MNGKVLLLDSYEMLVLEIYVYWMVSGVLIGVKLDGVGYLK